MYVCSAGPRAWLIEHHRLTLLSLQYILDLAFQELVFIGEVQLLPIRGDSSWKLYRDELMGIRHCVSRDTYPLGKLIKSTNHFSQSVFSASLDISCGALGEQEIVNRYSQKGHAGVAFILQLQNFSSRSSEAYVKNMLESREAFMSDLADLLEQGRLNELLEQGSLDDQISHLSFKVDLNFYAKTQLFIPRHLFANDTIVQAIQRDGRPDVLRRAVNHMLHDNNVVLGHAFVPRTDDKDELGRSSLHIACSMSMEERQSMEIDFATVAWPGNTMLRLDALDLAAMRGHVDIFQRAFTSDFDVFDHIQDQPPHCRTYIHWAACNGHVVLVRFLLEGATDSNIPLEPLLVVTDEDDQTALSLAAQHGHCDVVAMLLQFAEGLSLPGYYFAGAFFAAVQGRHFDVMKLLEPSTDLNSVQEVSDMTALTYADEQGFVDGIKFLLEKQANVNRVTWGWDQFALEDVRKTPLDFAAKGGYVSCVELLKKHGALHWWDLQHTR